MRLSLEWWALRQAGLRQFAGQITVMPTAPRPKTVVTEVAATMLYGLVLILGMPVFIWQQRHTPAKARPQIMRAP
jgi:hypothetical protein